MPWSIHLPLILAQAEAAAADAAAAPEGLSGGQKLVIAVAIIGGSFLLGYLLANWLRVRDYGFKIGLVLCTLVAGITVDIMGWPPKKGIDLSGGVVLVYEISRDKVQAENLDEIVGQVNDLLNKNSSKKRSVQVNDSGQIEIPLETGEDVAEIEDKLATLVNKGIVLTRGGRRTHDEQSFAVYNVEQKTSVGQSDDMQKLINIVAQRINPSGVQEITVRRFGADQIEVIVPEKDMRAVEEIKQLISTSGKLEFRILANPRDPDHQSIINRANQAANANARSIYRRIQNEDGTWTNREQARWVKLTRAEDASGAVTRGRGEDAEVLVLVDREKDTVTGADLSRSGPGADETGSPCVNFGFKPEGAEKFGKLTGDNVPNKDTGLKQRLGVVLDGELQSAPNIQSRISSEGRITGSFTQKEVDRVVAVLNSGSLPTALNRTPTSQQTISPQLGEETVQKGKLSMALAMAAVIVFMLYYYRFAGAVADVAVVMNMVLAIALMILVKAALTLPGLAGLVLTVGMAVDANVLIYERMREEAHRGASLRMAIRNGFARALSTIIDSNMTTIISAVVLYLVGTDQVKGFAVTLFIGLVVSMFTAIFVTHVIFDVFEKKRWLTRLNMRQLIGETHYDFVRWRWAAIATSVIVIAIGLGAVGMRGMELFDIDFTGGSAVHVLFKQDAGMTYGKVSEEVGKLLPDVAVSRVGEGTEYKIDTSKGEIEVVQKILKDAFADKLQTYSMSYKQVALIGQEVAAPAGGAAAPADDNAPAEQPAAGDETDNSVEQPKEGSTEQDEQPADADQPAKPDQGDGARHDLPSNSELAMAVPEGSDLSRLVLAQAGVADKGPADAAAASDARRAEAPDEIPSDEMPAADKSSDDESAGEADTAAPQREPSGAPADQTAGGAELGTPDRFAGGTSAVLEFPANEKIQDANKINYATLSRMIEQELVNQKYNGDNQPKVKFALDNPQYKPGSTMAYASWNLKIQLPPDKAEAVLQRIQADINSSPIFPSSNQIGTKVAGATQQAALQALLASMIIIVIYVWIRFKNITFGLAAVIALIHDVLLTLGFLALSKYLAGPLGFLMVDHFKISLAVMAAMLTIGAYSIYDTIVVFDRIREVRGKSPDLNEAMINASVNQTLSRTLLTSGTVVMGTVILYIFGGQGIHPFAYTMLIGAITGTYSTVYIAAPVLLWLRKPLAGESGRGGAGGATKGQPVSPGAK